MTIVVGYVPTPEGEAALAAGIREATLREEPLHVVNTSRGQSLVDTRFASEEALASVRAKLDASGFGRTAPRASSEATLLPPSESPREVLTTCSGSCRSAASLMAAVRAASPSGVGT